MKSVSVLMPGHPLMGTEGFGDRTPLGGTPNSARRARNCMGISCARDRITASEDMRLTPML